MRYAAIIIWFFVVPVLGWGQLQDTSFNWELMDMPLKDIVNIEVKTASNETSGLRTSPAIMTVITESEIKHSGTNSLMEVLSFVPGFEFSAEWDNIVGLGVRGNNATEGKFLILLDGFQLNETNFGTFPFLNHILLDNVSRIEVIRGPGSALYGGAAELAVINIITKGGDGLKGGKVSFYSGISNADVLEANAQAMYGDTLNKNWTFKLAAGHQTAHASNQTFTTLDSTTINYRDSSNIRNTNVHFQLSRKNLNFSLLYDNYLSDNTEALGKIKFNGLFAGADYTYAINEKWKLKPYFKWKQQKPWYFVNFHDKEFYNTTNNRIRAGVITNYSWDNKSKIIFGAESYKDYALKENDTAFTLNNKQSINFNNNSVFGELILQSKVGNLNFGARYDHHSHFGGAFVPRIAYTKAFEHIHFKMLYSKAFKAPTISNIDYNHEIRPEHTTVFELETGILLDKNFSLVVNFFDIQIADPIVYIPDPMTGADYYTNYDKTGSRGVELTSKYKPKWGFFNFSYSFYEKRHNQVADYTIEGKPDLYGGFPQHNVLLNAHVFLNDDFSLWSTMNWKSEAYTYVHADKNWETLSLVKYNEHTQVDLILNYHYKSKEGITLSLGIKNLLGTHYFYLNPYRGGQNPIPGRPRTYFFKAAFLLK